MSSVDNNLHDNNSFQSLSNVTIPKERVLLNTELSIRIILYLILLLGLLTQFNLGLADNGDFMRNIGWFSTGPVGLETWPEPGTEAFGQRFFKYWIPYWKLDFPKNSPGLTSSALLLWAPGIVLNYLFYSKSFLFLPLATLFPRFLYFVILWLTFQWIAYSKLGIKTRIIIDISLGLPLVLLMITTEYVVYLNSFYQETASFIFVFFLFAALIYLRRARYSQIRIALFLLAVYLLMTAKASNIYWVLILGILLNPWRELGAKPVAKLVGISIVAVLFVFISNQLTTTLGMNNNTMYESLFLGALTSSKYPDQRLKELNLSEARKCVSTSPYSGPGVKCLRVYGNQMSYLNTLQVFAHEPLVMARMIRYAADRMQNLSTYLGIRTFTDQRKGPSVILNLWAAVKKAWFPKGYFLLIILGAFTVIFLIHLQTKGFIQELSLIGLISSISILFDWGIALLAGGKADMIKHLYLANLLFDIALLAAFNLGVIYLLKYIKMKGVRL
jgi:hypothetical protein